MFFNRLGEIRDRSYEQHRSRAGGLTLLTAIIVLWSTVYLERVINALQEQDPGIDPDFFQHLSPLGWEHINLTGNYTWRSQPKSGRFRPLLSVGSRDTP